MQTKQTNKQKVQLAIKKAGNVLYLVGIKNVKPFQEEARFWFCVWSSAGKPIESLIPGVNHDLYTIMRHTRNMYNYAVRRVQKNLKSIENDKLLKKMGKPEFFDELKNLSKEKQKTVSSNIDNVYVDENIGNHFKNPASGS